MHLQLAGVVHEQLKHYYVREEEFLDHFEHIAIVAARLMQGGWTPDYHCDDAVRQQRERRLTEGVQQELVFAGAAVYHLDGQFSSVQVALKSSTRMVNLRVRHGTTEELVAEKVVDRLVPAP
jgi:hypothetical protein